MASGVLDESRARMVSAFAFGMVGAFVAVGVVGSLVGLTGARLAGGLAMLPVLSALVMALAGAAAGPMIARSPGPLRAIGAGIGALTVGIVVLAGASLVLLGYAEPSGRGAALSQAILANAPLVAAAVLAIALSCSPIGGLCGYAVWRRLQRPSS